MLGIQGARSNLKAYAMSNIPDVFDSQTIVPVWENRFWILDVRSQHFPISVVSWGGGGAAILKSAKIWNEAPSGVEGEDAKQFDLLTVYFSIEMSIIPYCIHENKS